MTSYRCNLFIIDRLWYVVLVFLIIPCLSISLRPLFIQSYDMNTSHISVPSLQWRYNGRDSVSNHKTHDCLLNPLFRCRSKKTSKLRVTGLCAGKFAGVRWISQHKWPATRKMFPFDDVIIFWWDTSAPLKPPHTGPAMWNLGKLLYERLSSLIWHAMTPGTGK